MGKNELQLGNSYHTQKIDSKYTIGLRVKAKTIELPEVRIVENFRMLG